MNKLGWLDKLRRKPNNKTVYAESLNGFSPIFSQFGHNIYASDVVQAAICCIVFEMKKLTPMHIIMNGTDPVPAKNSNVQRILNQPNELMTTSEFIEKMMWILFFNYNSFVVPTWDGTIKNEDGTERKRYTGLYPVMPSQVDFIQDASDKLFVKLTFANNYETTIPYDSIIHNKYKYSVNEFMGGNVQGQPDNDALLKTLELNHSLLEGVSQGMKSSFKINGVVKYNTLLDDGKTAQAIKDFESKIQASESGILPIDMKADYTQIKRDIQLVDEATLKFIDEKILRQFGVPLKILTGEYTKEDYEAFYQKTLEPLIISLSQAFTKALFTPREIGFGNKIMFYPKDLIFMSTDQKLEMVRLLGDSGAMYENEKRAAFGLRPLPELEGMRKQSLNYVDVQIANNYQLNNKGGSDNAEA